MGYSEWRKANNIPEEIREGNCHHFCALNDEEFEELQKAIIKWLPTHMKTVSRRYNSYYLKHRFENLLDFYINEYDLKLAMYKLGYKSSSNIFTTLKYGVTYNISSKEVAQLEEHSNLVKETRYK